MKWYMKNVHTFKSYFTQSNQPHDFREYVQSLNEEKLNRFYNQMKEPAKFIKDVNYLMYKFHWINKYDFDDLSKEIFLQSIFSVGGHEECVIKDAWFDVLSKRYEKDIQDLIDGWSS